MRPLILALLAAAVHSAEIARRDVQVAVERGDGGFAYDLGTGLGTFSGDDAFDSIDTLRLGGRIAFAAAGSPLGVLAGADLTRSEAPIDGGGMDGYGGDVVAGATWAIAEGVSLDGEGFAGWQQVDFALDALAAPLDGGGELWRGGARLRLQWSPWRHWSIGIEGCWTSWQADIAADDGRSLDLVGSGLGAGLSLAWRPSARPEGIE
ncbi:MAG: hypothetical protein J0M02_11720 [Planctomycetes bacterium]|nr:hypothetical protein [Planctomycetota bacterium]